MNNQENHINQINQGTGIGEMNKTLEELAHIFSGIDYKKNPPGDNIPIYGTGGLMGYTSVPLNFGPALLSGRKGSINNPKYVEGAFWNVDTIFCIKANEGIDTKWLYYNFLNTDLSKLNEATGVPSVNSRALYKLKFKWFELPEQRRIAQILSTADSVIEQTQATIAKYKAIKQGMLHDLFTRGIDIQTGKLRPKYEDAPELYKKSSLGFIPVEWEVKQLEELTTQIGDGIHTTPKYAENTDFYFINGNNLSDGEIIIGSALCVSEEEYKKHFKELNCRTILYSINGTIGNIALYQGEKVILGKSACYISCKTNINLDYVFFILQTFQISKYYELEMTGSTIKNLSLASVRNTPIAIPNDEKEQLLIAQRIKTINKKLQTEQNYLQKLQMLKRGLMGDLLSGKKRVELEEEYKT
jgi:type I restriction enzyme S subunit